MRWEKTAHFPRSFKNGFRFLAVKLIGPCLKSNGEKKLMYSSNSRTRTVYCSSKKSSWSGSWLIILSSSIFTSVFYTDQLLFIWHFFVLWSAQRGFLQLWMFTLKPFLIKINLRLKWCNQTLQLGTLTVQSSPLDFFHGHRFVLNLEIRPSFVFCWRGEGGHQSRLKGVFFKL